MNKRPFWEEEKIHTIERQEAEARRQKRDAASQRLRTILEAATFSEAEIQHFFDFVRDNLEEEGPEVYVKLTQTRVPLGTWVARINTRLKRAQNMRDRPREKRSLKKLFEIILAEHGVRVPKKHTGTHGAINRRGYSTGGTQ